MDVTRRKRLLGLLEAAGDILEDEELKAEKGFAGRVPLQIEIRYFLAQGAWNTDHKMGLIL